MSQSLQHSVTSSIAADDFALMQGIRARDAGALAQLYDRYAGAVYGLCMRALRDNRDAEDLLLDIFSEIWEKYDRFDPTRGSPIGHVMGLARSRVIDRLRSRRSATGMGMSSATDVDDAADLRESAVGPLDAAIHSEQRIKVVHAMQSLQPDQRQALELAFFEGLSHSEIADRLGHPLGTVKSRIRQALVHLRVLMGKAE